MRAAGYVRRGLDTLYSVGGVIGAVFLISILGLIVAQMVARWTGQVFPGSTDYAGYSMAGASFMALAYAMNRGAHIRVNLVLSHTGRWRRHAGFWTRTRPLPRHHLRRRRCFGQRRQHGHYPRHL